MTETDAPPRQERDHASLPTAEGKGGSRSWRLWTTVLGIPLVCVLLVNAFVMQPFLIPSHSMEDTLRPGDRVLVNKLAYRSGSGPDRGDVVVFDGTGTFAATTDAPGPLMRVLRAAGSRLGLMEAPGTLYIKRVIGLGGDRIVCCDAEGRLTVDGEPLEEPYLREGDAPSEVEFDIEVPPGRLWVMGDHRSDSTDSRDHLGSPGGGSVAEERVVGRAEFVGWPVGRWGSLRGADG